MKTENYLKRAEALLSEGNKSDGCTTPLANWVHKKINNAKLICAAHDFGSRGLIEGVRPGWHNNLMFFKANWLHGNYVWAVVSFIGTLPYALVRYNLGWQIGVAPFHALLALLLVIGGVYIYDTQFKNETIITGD